MGIEVPQPIINADSALLNFTNEGGIEGTTRFLKNITGMWLLEQCRKVWKASGKGFQRLALLEEAKTLPFGAVFDYFNYKNGVPVGEAFIPEIEYYEKEVTSKR